LGDDPDYIIIPIVPDQKLYSGGHHGNEFTFAEKKYEINLKALLVAAFVQDEKTKDVLQSALIKVQLEK
jgi:hypothetical protein